VTNVPRIVVVVLSYCGASCSLLDFDALDAQRPPASDAAPADGADAVPRCPTNAVLCDGFDGPTFDPAWSIRTLDTSSTIRLDSSLFGAAPPSVLATGFGSSLEVEYVAGLVRRVGVQSRVTIDLTIGRLTVTNAHRLELVTIAPLPLPPATSRYSLGLSVGTESGTVAFVDTGDDFRDASGIETFGGWPKRLHVTLDFVAGTFEASVDGVPFAAMPIRPVPGIEAIELALGLLSMQGAADTTSTVRFDDLVVTTE
jgi:hypothetical protein